MRAIGIILAGGNSHKMKELARKRAPIFTPGEMVSLTLSADVAARIDGPVTVSMERS